MTTVREAIRLPLEGIRRVQRTTCYGWFFVACQSTPQTDDTIVLRMVVVSIANVKERSESKPTYLPTRTPCLELSG